MGLTEFLHEPQFAQIRSKKATVLNIPFIKTTSLDFQIRRFALWRWDGCIIWQGAWRTVADLDRREIETEGREGDYECVGTPL